MAIIFVATLARSTFGFGESLIAVPLLRFLIPIEIAVPLSVLLSIVIAAVVVVQNRNQIHSHSAKWLILYATLGNSIQIIIPAILLGRYFNHHLKDGSYLRRVYFG